MSPIRIIFSTDSIRRGGKERQLSILCAQAKSKFSIFILTKQHEYEDHYLNEYNIPNEKIYTFQSFSDYRQLIIKLKPDVVISWDINTSLYGLILSTTCKFIFINGTIRHGIRLFKFSHIYRSILCHLSPFVLANSMAGLKVNNLIPNNRRFVLYNGIDTKFLQQSFPKENSNKRIQLIPEYAIHPGVIFITVANLVPFKDHISVLRALKIYLKTNNFYYFIIGDGPKRKQIEITINEFGLKNNVFLTGRIENVSDYLNICDIMIHSSRGEGISNAILEGMYAGLPIIATNVGGIPETVYKGSSILFPYKDDKALLDCLYKAPEVFDSFDPNSQDYQNHLSRFSLDNMIRRFEEIIEEIVQK